MQQADSTGSKKRVRAGYSVKGTGHAVVLLHGSMATRSHWRYLVDELCGSYCTIAMDLSGYGATGYPENPESYSLAYESKLLQEVLAETLGKDEPYHLIGHSYGGAVALHHAYHHRNRLLSLTAIEPMAYHLLEKRHETLLASEAMVAEITQMIDSNRSMVAAEKFIDLWMSPGTFARLSNQEKRVLGEGVKKMVLDFKAAKNEALNLADYELLPQPFHLIAGKTSPPFSLSITKRIGEADIDGELFWLDGGHFSTICHAHQLNPLVLDLLQRADRARGKPLPSSVGTDLNG